eukprot:2689523-Lingulodinium_polyedra.AAC.1
MDDPVHIAGGGGVESQVLELVLALLWASAAGFLFAWRTSEGGTTVDWVGASFTLRPRAFE